MIEYRENDEVGAYPVFICDYCGEPIVYGENGDRGWGGNLGWGHDKDYNIVGTLVVALHKSCTHAFELDNSAISWGMEELDVVMAQLAHNTKIDVKKARERLYEIGRFFGVSF